MGLPNLDSLNETELQILRFAWGVERFIASEAYTAIRSHHDVTQSTVSTTLKSMAAKGLIAIAVHAHPQVYQAKVERRTVVRMQLQRLAGRLFGGSTSSLAAEALEEFEIDAADRERIQKRLASDPE